MRGEYIMKKNKGFTLIEMMVVITIIMILMGLLMPALGRARRKARKIECLNNLRQIGIALNEYALDNNGSYPQTLNILTNNDDYLPATDNNADLVPDILKCPIGGTYNYNYITNEASLDSNYKWITCSSNHGGANPTNVLMGDGSVFSKAEE